MNADENDSLWLQKSIHIADPIPDVNEKTTHVEDTKTGDNVVCAGTAAADPEVELTKAPFVTNYTRPLYVQSQRPSSRLSVSNSTAFASFHELDELRARVSQMTRERLKWSCSQRDLEISRFELAQARDELKTLREYVKTIKGELDDANTRADRETRSRHALETSFNDTVSQLKSENQFLRQQLDAIKAEQSERLAEMAERVELENGLRTEAMQDQIQKLSEEVEALSAANSDLSQERMRMLAEIDELRDSVKVYQEKHEEARRSITGYTESYRELEEMHAKFVEEIEKSHAEALSSHMALSEERIRQVTACKDELVKDLRDELQIQKEKIRSLSDELSLLRHRYQVAEDESKQLKIDHEKEIKRIEEEHSLAICQQKLQTEALVREAKGGRLSVEEERSSLRRQLTRTTEELSTVTAILVQRDKHVGQLEKELSKAKDAALTLEQEHISSSKEVEALREALSNAEERVQRLMAQQDTLDVEYSKDLRELKEQLTVAQEELVRVKTELSSVTQENMKHETECRGIIADLRAKLEEAKYETGSLQQLTREKKQADELVEEYKSRYLSICKKAENLEVELGAATNRCILLEKRLDEELRRSLRNASSSPTPQRENCAGKRLRSASSVNVPLSLSVRPLKKSYSAESRVFTISGFEGPELLAEIKRMPLATVAECRSNAPVPTNLTHLITNGQLTIKLLTALVRGCWILPVAYVHDSVQNEKWLDESTYGFRHKDLPLLNKRVGFSEGFISSRHYITAKLIIEEGCAIHESDLNIADIVLCTHSELGTMDGVCAMTWDKVVELIYPVKIGDGQ